MRKGGPKPVPAALLRLAGSNRPRRKERRDEPVPAPGIPRPPAWLTREARAEWRRVCPELCRLGVVTIADGSSLVRYCEAHATYVAAAKAIPFFVTDDLDRSRALRHLRDARAAATREAEQLGLTPSSRARLSVGKPKQDELSRFLGGRTA